MRQGVSEPGMHSSARFPGNLKRIRIVIQIGWIGGIRAPERHYCKFPGGVCGEEAVSAPSVRRALALEELGSGGSLALQYSGYLISVEPKRRFLSAVCQPGHLGAHGFILVRRDVGEEVASSCWKEEVRLSWESTRRLPYDLSVPREHRRIRPVRPEPCHQITAKYKHKPDEAAILLV